MATLIEDDVDIHNTSYLNARVRSILAQNCPKDNTVDIKSSASDKSSDNLQIYLRVKKSQNFEKLYQIKNDNTLVCRVPKGTQSNRNNHTDKIMTKIYTFSKIFGPETNQSQIFKEVVEAKMVDFMNGINCTLLTYGASGSGKTFTVVGNSQQPGIIPRSLNFLFRSLPQLNIYPTIKPTHSGGIYRLSKCESGNEKSVKNNLLSDLQDVSHHHQIYNSMQEELRDEVPATVNDDISDVHLSVWISYAEIYNEYIYDLLAPASKLGQARKKLRLVYCNNSAYIKDLKYVNVSTASEAYCVLQYGLQNLNYASTSINDHSSRSHSIFTIRLAQASDTEEGISVSSFNFCDLAGSERVKKTNNVGNRLKESNNINTSLMVLGRCITAVRDMQKSNSNRIIPFRDSKFTQLLQKALSGHESIFMIVNINPIINMFDESQHVLNFSAIAKDVSVEQQLLIERPNKFSELNNKGDQNEIDADIEELTAEVALLQDQIEQEKLDHEEDMEHIIQTYKEMIANADKFWENTCQALQARIAENKRISLDFADKPVNENYRKRKNTSVIIIDSSSDEEGDKNKILKRRKSLKSMKVLQDELRLLKSEFETNEVVLQNTLTKNNNTKRLIEETKNMERQYQEEIEKLNIEIVKQENRIVELNNVIDCFHNKAEDSTDESCNV